MSNNQQSNYPWEDVYADKPLNSTTTPDVEQSTSSLDTAEILQHMLKDAPQDTNPPPVEDSLAEPDTKPAPINTKSEAPATPETTVQHLLFLAAQAEEQARSTEEAAQTTGALAQEMLTNLQAGNLPPDLALHELSIAAGQNAVIASEAALKAQLGAMEAHAAAINHSLTKLEQAKELFQQYSRDYIQQSRQAATADDNAQLAREQMNKARLEYAAKHNIALGQRDAMLQTKMDYENQLACIHQAQEDLETSQLKARESQQHFQQLQHKFEQRRKTWQDLQKLDLTNPAAAIANPIATDLTALSEGQPTLAPPLPLANAAAADQAPQASQEAAAAITAEDFLSHTASLPRIDETDFADLKEKKDRQPSLIWRLMYKAIIALLAVMILLQIFVIQLVTVHGTSMASALAADDFLLSNRIAYLFSEPQRGDIVILNSGNAGITDLGTDYIKRIIALPGETLQIHEGRVYINYQLLEELYLDPQTYTQGDIYTIIPSDHFFVLGDNRAASLDSRSPEVGPIYRGNIRGRVILRIFPFQTMTLL